MASFISVAAFASERVHRKPSGLFLTGCGADCWQLSVLMTHPWWTSAAPFGLRLKRLQGF